MERRRIKYELKCPNRKDDWKCEYHYWLEVFERPEWETCNLCGYFGRFEEFLIKEVKDCKS